MANPVKQWRNQHNVRSMLGKTGRIVSYTTIRVAPVGFEAQVPYVVVLVQCEGEKHMGQLVNTTVEPCIGQTVIAVLRRTKRSAADEVIPYGVKFVLVA